MSPKPPIQGTYVRESQIASVYYGDSRARLGLYIGASRCRVLLRWSLPPLRGKTVTSAKVRLYSRAPIVGQLYGQPHGPHKPGYDKATWDNQPDLLAGSTRVTFTQVQPGVWEGDFSAALQAVANGGPWHGIRIWTNATDNRIFLGGWAADDRPTLDVAATNAPPAPTDVLPDGVVSLPTFIVQWTPAEDAIGYQVQIDEQYEGDFATPLWDSGDQPSEVGQCDTAALGWVGQPLGGAVLLRVRQRNALGWSEYCPTITVPRRPKPTVTLAPLQPGDGTPLHQWTVTSGTQTQFTIEVQRPGSDKPFVRQQYGGEDTSWQPTNGPTEHGEAARTVLRVFGDQGHLDWAGDPIYTEIVHDWTLDLSGAGAPPRQFNAEQVGVTPQIRISWTSATVPDGWQISYRWPDGQTQVVARLDGLENQTSPGQWELLDWTYRPETDGTVLLQSITNGVLSQAAEVPLRTRVPGIWVVDITNDRSFVVAGTEAPYSWRHSVTTLRTLSGRDINYTLGLSGRGGTVKGQFRAKAGRTAEEHRAVAEQIMRAPELPYRQVWGDLNLLGWVTQVDPTLNLAVSQSNRVIYDVAWVFSEDDDQ